MATCFVIMGFGEKTDFQSNPQRVLNLNKTYVNIIKPAVEAVGLQCIRADEIIHSTVIDKPMYEQLLEADLVIADLSTANANALYELGVRHALKPWGTIVMAEKNFSFPFDLGHVSILKYEHLGTDIGFEEVMKVREALNARIVSMAERREVDSPVFLFLPALGAVDKPRQVEAPRSDASLAQLLDRFRAARRNADWPAAIVVLKALTLLQPDDPFVVQQLALATYKAEQPEPRSALNEAKRILAALDPETSSDAETVGLWGAIHKRLWEQGQSRPDLDAAVEAYERGFYFKRDHYTGINYAFLLDERAGLQAGDEAIADRVLARRVRGEVLKFCDALLERPAGSKEETFWIQATKAEALLGLGRREEAEAIKAVLAATAPEPWMPATTNSQLARLAALLPVAAAPTGAEGLGR